MVACVALIAAWLLTVMARRWNHAGYRGVLRFALAAGAFLAVLGGTAFVVGPWMAAMNPAAHVYPATVWVLVIWTVSHAALGVIMQLYCLARSLAGKLTAEYDIDIWNVALYWHFMAITTVVTFAVIALFPLVA